MTSRMICQPLSGKSPLCAIIIQYYYCFPYTQHFRYIMLIIAPLLVHKTNVNNLIVISPNGSCCMRVCVHTLYVSIYVVREILNTLMQ
jgi:hypothetical protein